MTSHDPMLCLFPTDLGPLSTAAAPVAADYVRRLSARLTVLRVLRTPIAPSLRSPTLAGPAAAPTPESEDNPMASAEQTLAAFIDRHFAGLGATPVLAAGSPTEAITAYAAEQGVDLILVPTHADGVLHRLIHGSVSKSILESAPCPVLMLPAQAVRG